MEIMVDEYIHLFLDPKERQQLKHILLLWISAFFFHTIADPAVTYVAVVLLDAGVEANPFLRGWLHEGLSSFILIHTPLYVIGILGFLVLRWLFKRGSEREQNRVYYLSIVVLSGINLWGVLLVSNNLWVIWTHS